jgi:hypothetical protein
MYRQRMVLRQLVAARLEPGTEAATRRPVTMCIVDLRHPLELCGSVHFARRIPRFTGGAGGPGRAKSQRSRRGALLQRPHRR